MRNNNSDGLPMTIADGNPKRRRSFWKRMTKRWYKSDYDPLCANFAAFSDFGLATKRRSFPKLYLLIAGVLALLVLSLVKCWFILFRFAFLRDRRTFPLLVRIEGVEFLPITPTWNKPLDFPVLIPAVVSRLSNSFHNPDPLDADSAQAASDADYGLNLQLMEENVTRVIFHDFLEDVGEVRDYSVKDDDVDPYYAYDDDYKRDVYKTYDGDEMKNAGPCRRLDWHRYYFPNCNSFHEMDMTVNVPAFVGNGAYRDVFTRTHHFLRETEQVVWKTLVWNDGAAFTFDMFEFTRMDALVSERFTSNNRFVDILGHCGVSMLSEYLSKGNLEKAAVAGSGFIKQADLHDQDDVKPQNKFSAAAKLSYALQMAELIAALHDYPHGKIVHNDIQLSQFLFDQSGMLKFNDFNRAEIMLWDEQKQDYCRYRNGPGGGNNRAPEEYYDKPVNEKIDVFSFGNGVYGLLTGLWPFYELDEDHETEMQEKLKRGETPFVDPRYHNRSFEEGILVDIMNATWAYDPDDRPDMISLVTKLRLAKLEMDKHVSKHS